MDGPWFTGLGIMWTTSCENFRDLRDQANRYRNIVNSSWEGKLIYDMVLIVQSLVQSLGKFQFGLASDDGFCSDDTSGSEAQDFGETRN